MSFDIQSTSRLRIAIQKSGRLSEKSLSILEQCGVDMDRKKNRLLVPSYNFPIELMLVRDDDIPDYVNNDVCDIGIVGRNVMEEKCPSNALKEIRALDFGYCRLSIAATESKKINTVKDLQGKSIATSYPMTLSRYLKRHDVQANIITVSGSVEITPSLNLADAICDLVSTGETLRANGLKETFTLLQSQAILIGKTQCATTEKQFILSQLLQRMNGVIKAQNAKYIMMNAPSDQIEQIKTILPGMEEPTIVPLTTKGKVAIHAVAQESIFWETMERLKAIGASSILVVPIEKIIE